MSGDTEELIAPLLRFHETGGQEGDGSNERIALIRQHLATLSSSIAAPKATETRPALAEERETWASINKWCDDTFGPATIPQIIARAKEEFDELETPGADHAIEAADVVICLCRIPGFADALERKMAINRQRKWRLTGNGTGYHIKDAALTPAPVDRGGE